MAARAAHTGDAGDPGDPPPPPPIPIRDRMHLVTVLRELFEAANLSCAMIDDIAGISSGQAQRMLACPPAKSMGIDSAFLLIATAGKQLVLVDDEQAMARIKGMKRYQQRHPSGRTRATHGSNTKLVSMIRELARNAAFKGVAARMAKTTPKQRQAIARKAIRARWRKQKAAA